MPNNSKKKKIKMNTIRKLIQEMEIEFDFFFFKKTQMK